ncbi:SDR family oxidoreductase [Streptosporangium fragile]|uniref:SDR family oxidoreductase n=1 Tax=Streptosporangium fragile TaxID=46186 RepID=A0ABP6I608_9ACTN
MGVLNRRRTALVTGGAGFVGSHLCERLLARGWRVVCLDNLSTGSARNIEHLTVVPEFRFVEADVTEPLELGERTDLVFHLASPASPRDYLRLPLETLRAGSLGTEHALRLATACDARLVLASTSEVYGDPEVHPQPESYPGRVNPVGPRSVYDEAKRYAEAITAAYRREFGTRTAIARIFNTYGPRMRADDGRLVPTFITQALRDRPFTVNGNGTQTRSLCYVDDTADGLIALALSDAHGPVNLGNPDERSVLEIAELIAALAGVDLRVDFRPELQDDPRQRCPDVRTARGLLRWEPVVSVEEGLGRTLEWFREEASAGARDVSVPVGGRPAGR